MQIDLKEKLYMIKLFDEYKSLLTKTQIKYLSHYYFDDYSLREISELFSVSRNAIHDAIVKSEKALKKYEEILGNLKYKEKIADLLENIENTKNLAEVQKLINDHNAIDKEKLIKN